MVNHEVVHFKSRFNTPLLRFVFWPQESSSSWQEFLCKNFFSASISFSPGILPRFCFLAGFSPGSWRRFFLGRILARTVFWAGFLLRCAAGNFSGKDPTAKTGLLSGIPAGSQRMPGFLAGSRQDCAIYFTRVHKHFTKN